MNSFGISKQQARMVVALLAGAVLVVLNQTLLSPALPTIMVDMGVDATTIQWLTSGYALTEAVMIPLSAWFMGRLSTRTLFIGGMGIFACGSLVAALAPAFPVILLGRILQAMATGILMVMVMSLILLIFPREKRGAAMGLVSLVIMFAPAVGPSVGGVLVDAVGWRALFVVVTALTVLVILLAVRALENHEGFPRTHFDVPSVLLSSFGLAMLLYGLSSFSSSENLLLCVGLMVAGAVLAGLFAWRQTRLPEPMLLVHVFKSRKYRTAVITIILLEASLIGLSVLMPLYIQNSLGFSATVSGLMMLPGALIGAAASLLAGKIFDRSGVRDIALGGGAAFFLSGVGMCFYTPVSPVVFVVAVNIVMSTSLQLLTTPVNTWGVNSLDNRVVQHATAVTNTMNQVGASLGTALIMSFTAIGSSMSTATDEVGRVFAGYHASFIVAAVLMGAAFVLIVFFVRDKKGEVNPVIDVAGMTGGAPAPRGDVAGSPRIVADVMDADPVFVLAGSTVSDAARLLAGSDLSGAPVVTEDLTVIGFVSNSDILRFFGDEVNVATGLSGFTVLRYLDDENVREGVERLKDLDVMQIATKKVVSVTSTDSFATACAMLAEKRFKEIPVVDNGKLVGVVRRRSLMRLIAWLLDDERTE